MKRDTKKKSNFKRLAPSIMCLTLVQSTSQDTFRLVQVLMEL